MNEWLPTSKYSNMWLFTMTIVEKLVEPEKRKLQEMVDKLVIENSKLKNKRYLAFTQNGITYKHSTLHTNLQGVEWRPALVFSLSDQFEEFKKVQDELAQEKAVMRQVLTLLYEPTHNLQELRDSTPEYLVQFVPEFQDVPRFLRDHLTLVKGQDRLIRQFEKIEPLFKLHAASHLLY